MKYNLILLSLLLSLNLFAQSFSKKEQELKNRFWGVRNPNMARAMIPSLKSKNLMDEFRGKCVNKKTLGELVACENMIEQLEEKSDLAEIKKAERKDISLIKGNQCSLVVKPNNKKICNDALAASVALESTDCDTVSNTMLKNYCYLLKKYELINK